MIEEGGLDHEPICSGGVVTVGCPSGDIERIYECPHCGQQFRCEERSFGYGVAEDFYCNGFKCQVVSTKVLE